MIETNSWLQSDLEDIQFALRIPQRKPWGTMKKKLQSALQLTENSQEIMQGVPDAEVMKAEDLVKRITKGLYRSITLSIFVGQLYILREHTIVSSNIGYCVWQPDC